MKAIETKLTWTESYPSFNLPRPAALSINATRSFVQKKRPSSALKALLILHQHYAPADKVSLSCSSSPDKIGLGIGMADKLLSMLVCAAVMVTAKL